MDIAHALAGNDDETHKYRGHDVYTRIRHWQRRRDMRRLRTHTEIDSCTSTHRADVPERER